jgi:DNA polymerase-3 subunit epsilon
MKFCSLDVETANHNQGSICQIGIGVFDNGKLVDTWVSYIDPRDYFHPRFIGIHGISPKTVKFKPTFPKVYSQLSEILGNNIVVHHSPFDKIAFQKAYSQNGLNPIAMHWLDSVRVARHTWSEFSEGGYNLEHLAWQLDIEFKHHDALEDAVAAGRIVLAACRKSGLSVEDFHNLFNKS